MAKRATPGIIERHSRRCRSREGASCDCTPFFEAWVWSAADQKKIAKCFPTRAAAKSWRSDTAHAVRRRELRAPTSETLREAAEAWLAGCEKGEILSRTRRPYKPSTIRSYRRDLAHHVYPDLGARKLAAVDHVDLQGLADRLVGEGLSGQRVRNVLVPLQALYRRRRRDVPMNPTAGLDLPAPGGRRERAASVVEADRLLAALPPEDRALWATAFFAGLRRGELRALRDEDVDLDANIIRVSRGWDDVEGEITTKSTAGDRRVPVPALLRGYLLEHRMRTGRRGADLFFGRTRSGSFTPTAVRSRARKAWAMAGLEPIGLHECRHTFVSLLHDAGIALERIGDYVGHSSAYMTDRYRHLLEGHEEETARRFDAYLASKLTGEQTGEQRL